MRTKCNTCLCNTCLETCCERKNRESKKCKGKVSACKDYQGFRQESIFVQDTKQEYKPAPRASWESYGLGDKAYRKKLYLLCQSGKYRGLVRQAAYQASEEIAEYIIKSVTQKKSYGKIEFDRKLGRICVCQTDFYGYRRLFYHLFDLEVRIGK